MKQKEAGVGTYLKKYIDSRNLVSAKGSGRAVASDARGLWFESSHRQTFITDIYLFTVNCIEETKIKRKRLRMAHFYNLRKRDRGEKVM